MHKIKDNYLFKIMEFFLVLIVCGLIFRKFYYKDIVNSAKLEFITDSQDNQAYHPKVISFDTPWNGYKYWAAFTPYKNANEEMENPCINASNDLINWENPNGVKNPIDKPKNADVNHYNSDTHILYNPATDKLELFWRYVDDIQNTVTIYKSTSSNGADWSEKEIFLYSSARSEQDYVSPAIILEDNVYRIWYVNNKQVEYIEKSNDQIINKKVLKINYSEKLYTWHIDVIKNGNTYEMVMVAYQNVNNRRTMKLYYTASPDNENFSTAIKIMDPSNKDDSWDNEGLYRSSILYSKFFSLK